MHLVGQARATLEQRRQRDNSPVAEGSDQGDPESPQWGGIAWSAWHELDDTAERGLVPRERGIYRLRCKGRPAWSMWVLATGSGPGSGGCRARSHPPDYLGHSAAACVARHEAQGDVVEVSWAPVGDMSRHALMGLEVDLIAACRARFGESPACQFHGESLE